MKFSNQIMMNKIKASVLFWCFRVANIYNLCLFLIQFIPAGLLSIFISPFADIYGLKVPLMVATAGGCVQVNIASSSFICKHWWSSTIIDQIIHYYTLNKNPLLYYRICSQCSLLWLLLYQHSWLYWVLCPMDWPGASSSPVPLCIHTQHGIQPRVWRQFGSLWL